MTTKKITKKAFHPLHFKEIAALAEALAIIAAMVALMINPKTYMQAFSNGLYLFAINVLPCTFPYLFFSKLLSLTGFSEKVSRFLGKPLRLFGVRENAAYATVIAYISGYPLGAKMTADLYKVGEITEKEAKVISTFTSVSGPLFVLGTVGASIFGNQKVGVVLLTANYASAIINGILWRCKYEKRECAKRIQNKNATLPDVVYDTVLTVLIVGGYIALFNMLADMLQDAGILSFLASVLTSTGVISYEIAEGAFFGLLEMTRGAAQLAKAPLSPASVATACAVIAFGGLSVALQSITFLAECKVKAWEYFARKLTQSIIAFAIGYGLWLAM